MNRNREIKDNMTEFTLEGVTFILGPSALEEPFSSGDMYLAERNTGPHLLECNRMSDNGSCVFAKPDPITGLVPYAYDSWECRKVL